MDEDNGVAGDYHAHGEKMDKSDAEYREGEPFRRCGICVHYRDHKCEIVAGFINPTWSCRYFEPKGDKLHDRKDREEAEAEPYEKKEREDVK